MKWLRTYPVLVAVGFLALGAVLEGFGASNLSALLGSVAQGTGFVLDGEAAGQVGVLLTGIVAGLGALYKTVLKLIELTKALTALVKRLRSQT